MGETEPLWDAPDNCKRNVLRCEILSDSERGPKTVILKRIASPKTLYDPEDLLPGTIAWRHGTEWSACRFLNRLDSAPPLSPCCYGGDRLEALLVLEDLGTGSGVASLLKHDDPTRAEQALLAYAETLGRLHATTCGREAEYNRIRNDFGMPLLAIRDDDLTHVRRHFERVKALIGSVGGSFSPAAEDELEGVLEILYGPSPFLVLTHGDPNPVNDLLQGDTVRLYDFEYSGFRHALLDGVFSRHLYPWTRHRLPDIVLVRLEAHYRQELVRGCPAAEDEARYRYEQMCARSLWMLVTLRSLLERALEQDGYEDDRSENEHEIAPTLRQRALILLERFAEDAETYACLPALSAAVAQIGAILKAHWQITTQPLPLYPAFRPDSNLPEPLKKAI